MLNRERKEAFVEYQSTQYSGTNLETFKKKMLKHFVVIEATEDALGKDVCEFSADEIKGVLEKAYKNYSSAKDCLRAMRLYTKWCAGNGYCPENKSYDIVSASDINCSQKQAESLFPGYNAFSDYLSKRFRPLDEMSIDNITRAVCWLLYFGVDMEDLGRIRNADYSNGVVNIGRTIIDLSAYPEARESLDTLASQTVIRKKKGFEDIRDTPRLIKYNLASKTLARTFVCYLGKINEDQRREGVECVSTACIIKSGLFWRMKRADDDTAAMMATRYIYGHYHSSDKVMKFQMKQLTKAYRAWVGTSE